MDVYKTWTCVYAPPHGPAPWTALWTMSMDHMVYTWKVLREKCTWDSTAMTVTYFSRNAGDCLDCFHITASFSCRKSTIKINGGKIKPLQTSCRGPLNNPGQTSQFPDWGLETILIEF